MRLPQRRRSHTEIRFGCEEKQCFCLAHGANACTANLSVIHKTGAVDGATPLELPLLAETRTRRRTTSSISNPTAFAAAASPSSNAKSRRAEEIDRSGSTRHLERAAKRLKHVSAVDRVLYVPQWDMAKAELAMRKAGVTGAVSNLCGTRRKIVRAGRTR